MAENSQRWTWAANGKYLVTCNPDRTIPLNSKVILEVTDATMSFGDELHRSLIAAAPELLDACELVIGSLPAPADDLSREVMRRVHEAVRLAKA